MSKKWTFIEPSTEALHLLVNDLARHRRELRARTNDAGRVFEEDKLRVDLPNQRDRYAVLRGIGIKPQILPSELIISISDVVDQYLMKHKDSAFADVMFELIADEYFAMDH